MSSKGQAQGKESAAAKQPSSKPTAHDTGKSSQHLSAIIKKARLDPSGMTPRDVLLLQRTVGNRAVELLRAEMNQRDVVHTKPGAASFASPHPGRLSIHTNAPPVIQRHNMPMPQELKPPAIAGTKQSWTVSSILSTTELAALKQQLMALIPADAQPSPADRIAALKYTDCPTPSDMPSGYGTAAAKVTDTGGIYFNNSLDDYYNADGSPNADKIKTTIVHESMHAVSAKHTGLQDYADLMSATKGQITTPQHQPDEAVTDYLSLQVYEAVFGTGTPYVTAYWVPASSKVAGAADAAKKTLAQNQQLPSSWTGQMVDILQGVLGVDDDKLKDLYFKDPAEFGKLIQGKEAEIRNQWNLLLGKETLEKHEVLSTDYKDPVLEEVIKEKAAELYREPEESARVAIVKAGLKAKKVPATLTPTSKAPVFSDTVIKKKIAETLGAKVSSLPPELADVKQVTKDLVEELIQQKNEAALAALYRSELFPLSAWTSEAWATFQDWNSSRSS